MNYKGNLKEILNQDLPASWVKEIEYADGKKGAYLPIDKVEMILDNISDAWSVEIKNTIFLSHSVTVIVKVIFSIGVNSYFNEGGATILVSKDVTPQAAFPIAKSMAIKDACECFGRVFGRDLNRGKDLIVPKNDLELIKGLCEKHKDKLKQTDIDGIVRIIANKETKSYSKAINMLNKYESIL